MFGVKGRVVGSLAAVWCDVGVPIRVVSLSGGVVGWWDCLKPGDCMGWDSCGWCDSPVRVWCLVWGRVGLIFRG